MIKKLAGKRSCIGVYFHVTFDKSVYKTKTFKTFFNKLDMSKLTSFSQVAVQLHLI